MFSSRFKPASVLLTASLLSAITLSACASKPDRRGPPPEDRKSSQKPRASGTFLHPIAALFVSMDKNADKVTSRAELSDGIKSEWSEFDGSPSAVYFTPWVIENLGSMDSIPNFMSFDRDFNGVITQQEFQNELEQTFARLDKNKDGTLDRSEMIVAFRAPQGQRSGGERRQGRSEQGERGGRGNRPPR